MHILQIIGNTENHLKGALMNWVEIVNIRLSNPKDISKTLDMFGDLRADKNSVSKENIEISLYQQKGVEGDWAIHIDHKSLDKLVQKSRLAHMIVEMYRPLGLVNYSIWENK